MRSQKTSYDFVFQLKHDIHRSLAASTSPWSLLGPQQLSTGNGGSKGSSSLKKKKEKKKQLKGEENGEEGAGASSGLLGLGQGLSGHDTCPKKLCETSLRSLIWKLQGGFSFAYNNGGWSFRPAYFFCPMWTTSLPARGCFTLWLLQKSRAAEAGEKSHKQFWLFLNKLSHCSTVGLWILPLWRKMTRVMKKWGWQTVCTRHTSLWRTGKGWMLHTVLVSGSAGRRWVRAVGNFHPAYGCTAWLHLCCTFPKVKSAPHSLQGSSGSESLISTKLVTCVLWEPVPPCQSPYSILLYMFYWKESRVPHSSIIICKKEDEGEATQPGFP